ncbi:MAG TPA: helix-turn-helix domain-containing protein [Solirubrobacteraceae bacterium]|nr:helix-turn-helix domain-containing protein [Solirubrobacteraceae bacterium]
MTASPRGARTDRRTRAARAQGTDARVALLAAAAELFAKRGFAGASVDEIAERAGYSKGALYWHFESKDELFFALMDASVDAPTHEMIELLQTAPPEQDMAPEGSRRLVELINGQRDMLLLDHEYWAQAVRDPELRRRYLARREELRTALGRALQVRLDHLGAPAVPIAPAQMATVVMCLAAGFAQERLIESDAASGELLAEAIVLLYRGLLASAEPHRPRQTMRPRRGTAAGTGEDG